jgi:hypothetical protein
MITTTARHAKSHDEFRNVNLEALVTRDDWYRQDPR